VLLLSFAGAWGLGSFYCILPELMDSGKAEYATGFIGGIADIGMPVGPLVFGVAFGVKGLWTAAWVSCVVICLVSVLGSAALLRSRRRGQEMGIIR
jgi:nitrate/nitrite transporter NarK